MAKFGRNGHFWSFSASSKPPKKMGAGKMLRNVVRICPEDYNFHCKTKIALKIRKKWQIFDFFKISFVIFAIFLYKSGPTGGGVKRRLIGLKDFL